MGWGGGDLWGLEDGSKLLLDILKDAKELNSRNGMAEALGSRNNVKNTRDSNSSFDT